MQFHHAAFLMDYFWHLISTTTFAMKRLKKISQNNFFTLKPLAQIQPVCLQVPLFLSCLHFNTRRIFSLHTRMAFNIRKKIKIKLFKFEKRVFAFLFFSIKREKTFISKIKSKKKVFVFVWKRNENLNTKCYYGN